jgi:DDE superfamily endonuclease
VGIPIGGGHARRILHGALHVGTGDVPLLVTKDWAQREQQHFLNVIRAHGRGWDIVLFEDRATHHTCPASRRMAEACGIGYRLLPRATPELDAMGHLWKHTQGTVRGARPTQSIERSAPDACEYILGLSPPERLRKGGVLSGGFWLGP